MGVTIKDVAKAAGVSISTVSKVINGHYSISEETQERVQQVIQELNFYPSASAQNFEPRGLSLSLLTWDRTPLSPTLTCLRSLQVWRKPCGPETIAWF